MSNSPHPGSFRPTTKAFPTLAVTVILGCLVLWLVMAGLAGASSSDGAPSSEFNYLRAAGNSGPEGIWSDGQTMWVADRGDAKIYAYSMTTKERVSQREFNALEGAGNNAPRGIWSDGETMWVADANYHRAYAYNMATKERDKAKEFDLWNVLGVFGNSGPEGIWSDGETMWVADDGHTGKLYAYSLGTGLRVESKELNLRGRTAISLGGGGNPAPRGIWSDGETMWVADEYGQMVYAYSMSTGERLPHKEITSLGESGNRDARGIWSDGQTMWVADAQDDKIYSFAMQAETGPSHRMSDRMPQTGHQIIAEP